MRRLRELTTYASLAELVDILEAQISDGETSPEVEAEGEKEFVKLHKTEKHPDPYGNKGSEAMKKDKSKAAAEPKPGFPPVKEELDEAEAREVDKNRKPATIARPKFDAKGNLIITQKAAKNIGVYKPTTRKIKHGASWNPSKTKRFGEEKEIDELREPRADEYRELRHGPKGKKERTVLVTNKGDSAALRGGGVHRIPKSKYNPKVHNLAEDQLDELKTKTLASYIRQREPGLKVAAYSTGAYQAHGTAPEYADYHLKQMDKYSTGIRRAADRLGGTYEVGKERKFKVPGDETNKTYTQKKRKIYHAEETKIDEGKYTYKTEGPKPKDKPTAWSKRLMKMKIGGGIPHHPWKAKDRDASMRKPASPIGKKTRTEETQLDEVSAPGEETWIKHRKGDFKKRYGDRWKEVLYATAWSRSKHNYPRG